ncbi:MAG: DsbA family protein, partial [Nitrosopumilus sp.]
CYKFHQDTLGVINEDFIKSGKVKIVFKDFPLNGPDSKLAAEASYCADDQEKYWQYHDELYKNWGGERTGWITRDALTEFAKEVKLDINEFNQCLDDQKYEDKVTELYDFGKNIGIDATPSFLVFNNENIIKIRGNQPLEVFLKTFDELSQ